MSAQNREKLTPLVRKMSALTQSLYPLVHADIINFENSEFFASKKADVHSWRTHLIRKMSALNKPLPLVRTSFMDGP